MEVITGAMSTLLPKLGELLKEEYKLQNSVRGEIRFLKAELEFMQAALLDISEASIDQSPNRQDKLWTKAVRELSYDLEDTIDKFMVRIDHAPKQLHGLKGFIDRSLNLLTDRNLNLLTKAKIRHEMAIDIKVIKARITEVSERRRRYEHNYAAKATGPSIIDTLRLSVIYKKATELIGTEEKSNDLVKSLMKGYKKSNPVKIVSIVGSGGLGKTTLANVVYGRLKGTFDCSAFVTVSLHPVMDKIFRDMLGQLDWQRYTEVSAGMMDETQLINVLRDLLRRKRYFIVIDDIWSKFMWENIMCALIENELGSIIITTTRILDVSKQAGNVYQLKPLSRVDSRKLFYLRIFGAEDRSPPNELIDVSENILRKCGGVPLAIITVSSMLASKKEKEKTHEYWFKACQSLGSGLEDTSDDVKNMRMILSVSYYDLPLHLRTCLLYLSLYPEDYEISTTDLVWKWTGEGFLKELGKDMFEVGMECIYELLNRSLIQPSRSYNESKPLSHFQIHDMVLDLITFLSKKDNFLTKLGAQQHKALPDKIRRLSLQTSNEEDVKKVEIMSFSHVRSLLVFRGASNLFPGLSRFPVLRVLDFARGVVVRNDHFKDICNLFHLRYLALHCTSITEIPKEIGNLKFLHILDISETMIVELPPSFVQLQQLVYLLFDTLVTIPDGFGHLKCLRELKGDIHFKSPATLQVLGGLTRLRCINLVINEWHESYERPFLSWMSTFFSLSILYISLLTLGERDLQILGSMPSLSHLAITVVESKQSREKELLVIDTICPFLCLTKFEMYDNMEVMFAQGAMQKLQSLTFSVRDTMGQFGNSSFGLEKLPSLEHVFIEMILSHANPELVEGVKTTFEKAVLTNHIKPRIEFSKRCVLKLNIPLDERRKQKVFVSVSKLYDIDSISIDQEQGKLTVCGMVDPTIIINNLKKDGIKAEPWDWDARALAPSGIKQTATTSEAAS